MAKPTALISAAGLVGGFAVARATEIRPLGGLVWGLAGAVCTPTWKRKAGPLGAVALNTAYSGALGVSHPIAKKIGAWPAVLVTAGGFAGLAWALADRR
jgi:hypothetical protein